MDTPAPRFPDPLESARIFLVDDERANLLLLRRMLEVAGFRNLVPIQDPRELFRHYGEERPDLILLDWRMPHLDGGQIMKALEDLQDLPAPPIIVLTAYADRQNLVDSLERKARDFLVKPFDREELLLRVRNALKDWAELLRTHRAWRDALVLGDSTIARKG